MTRPLAITWLLEDTGISGSVRTSLAWCDALVRRGHHVRIATKGQPLNWRGSLAEWSYVDRFEEAGAESHDFVIATSWSTLEPALRLGSAQVLHLCLADEAARVEDAEERERIEAAYALPIPRLVPFDALATALSRFASEATTIGTIVDDGLFRDPQRTANHPLRVLLCGHARTQTHGLDYGYGAAAHARWFHQTFDLIRLSPWAPSREEPLDSVQEFHVALNTVEAARLFRSCDILIAPNQLEEDLDVVAAEAMAAGLACVMTQIPAHEFDPGRDYALFAPPSNPVELGERLMELLAGAELRDRLRTRAQEIAEAWKPERAVERLERQLLSKRG